MPSLPALAGSTLSHTYRTNDTYRRELSIGIGLMIGCGLICLFFSIIALTPTTLSGILSSIPIVLIGISMIGYTLFAARRYAQETQLVLTPTTIAYHTPGIVIETTWENVQALRLQMRKVELVLKEPSSRYKSIATTFLQATSSASRDIDKRIPLHVFTVWTPQSQLYRDIGEFAPHLLKVSTSRERG